MKKSQKYQIKLSNAEKQKSIQESKHELFMHSIDPGLPKP